MTPEQTISIIANGAGIAVALFFIKKWMSDVKEKIDSVCREIKALNQKHHECRESLPKIYADKKETDEDMGKIWGRVDDHSIAIARILGMGGGNGAGVSKTSLE